MRFRWSSKWYDMKQFIRKFSGHLPLLIQVEEGYCSMDILDTFGSGDIYWITHVNEQERAILKDRGGLAISVPLDYRIKFSLVKQMSPEGVPLQMETTSKKLKTIIDETALSPEKVFVKIVPGEDNQRDTSIGFLVGGDVQLNKQLGLLEYVDSYDEIYLVGNTFWEGKLLTQSIIMPAYVPIRVSLVEGLTDGDDDLFKKTMKTLDSQGRTFNNQSMAGNPEILLYTGGLSTCDYSYAEPNDYLLPQVMARTAADKVHPPTKPKPRAKPSSPQTQRDSSGMHMNVMKELRGAFSTVMEDDVEYEPWDDEYMQVNDDVPNLPPARTGTIKPNEDIPRPLRKPPKPPGQASSPSKVLKNLKKGFSKRLHVSKSSEHRKHSRDRDAAEKGVNPVISPASGTVRPKRVKAADPVDVAHVDMSREQYDPRACVIPPKSTCVVSPLQPVRRFSTSSIDSAASNGSSVTSPGDAPSAQSPFNLRTDKTVQPPKRKPKPKPMLKSQTLPSEVAVEGRSLYEDTEIQEEVESDKGGNFSQRFKPRVNVKLPTPPGSPKEVKRSQSVQPEAQPRRAVAREESHVKQMEQPKHVTAQPVQPHAASPAHVDASEMSETYSVYACAKDVPKDLKSLNKYQVADVLRVLKLDKYQHDFIENEIDGVLLTNLDEETLIEDLNFKKLEAKKLVVFVKENWRPGE